MDLLVRVWELAGMKSGAPVSVDLLGRPLDAVSNHLENLSRRLLVALQRDSLGHAATIRVTAQGAEAAECWKSL